MIPFRMNYSIDEEDTVRYQEAKKLEGMKLLHLSRLSFKECTCGERLYEESFSTHQLEYCPGCGKRVRTGSFNKVSFKIDKIFLDQIIKLIGSKVQPLRFRYHEEKRLFVRESNDELVNIIIPEISTCNSILNQQNGDNCIFICLDPEKSCSRLLEQWSKKTFDYLSFMGENNESIEDLATAIARPTRKKSDVELGYILKKSPIFFEKTFVPFLLSQFQDKENQLKSYLLKLRVNSSFLSNAKVVLLGGPSNPDFYILDLSKYLSDGLQPNRYGESKRYCRTRLSFSGYGTALTHAKGGDTLFFVSTCDIQKEVWVNLIDEQRIRNYFKHVILDEDLILMLIGELDIDLSLLK